MDCISSAVLSATQPPLLTSIYGILRGLAKKALAFLAPIWALNALGAPATR